MPNDALATYLAEVQGRYGTGIAVEHSYRPALQKLLEQLAPGLMVLNEARRINAGMPDLVVKQQSTYGLLDVGYVEAKDIGRLDGAIERTDQMKRYLAELPNLILTDYLEFRHYVGGKKRETARLAHIGPDGRLVRDHEGAAAVERMLVYFLRTKPEEITRAEDLARRMAYLTRHIRDAIVLDFEHKAASAKVREWRMRLAKDLVRDLDQPQKTGEFADMFAQTLAYGLFSARTMDVTPDSFTDDEAKKLIPKTNPFLMDFFYDITGPRLRDESFAPFVDDLVTLLAHTKMDRVLEDFGKGKQGHDPVIHFYETFLAAYDPKLREARGVYYTPEPVVQYIVRSVDWLLKTRFKQKDGLASREMFQVENRDPNLRLQGKPGMRQTKMAHRVQVLDPACGTGTFLYAMVNLIRERMMQSGNAGDWSEYVREHLLPRTFGFELLMAPYAVAHFKLGLQLAGGDLPEEMRGEWRYDFSSDERLHVYLTNTLEEAHPEGALPMFDSVARESIEADEVKRDRPIMVVMGNPPYSGHSANKGQWIADLLHGREGPYAAEANYFEVDGKPLGEKNPKWLNDDYVKFIRFAQWRIEKTGQGILAFISNNGYLDNATFRGMRQALMQTFTDIYILNLHGNSKKKETAPDGSKDENVFDIQQGVAIGIFVKEKDKQGPAQVYHSDLWGVRGTKYRWLLEHDVSSSAAELQPQAPTYMFVPQTDDAREEYEEGWKIVDAFSFKGAGFKTHRDGFALAFTQNELQRRISDLLDTGLSDDTVAGRYGLADTGTWRLSTARSELRADSDVYKAIRSCLYRPFDRQWCFLHDAIMDRPRFQTQEHLIKPNIALVTTRSVEIQRGFEHVSCTNMPTDHHAVSLKEANFAIPLYLYPEGKQADFSDGRPNTPGGRRPNLNPAFVGEMAGKLGLRFVPDGKGDLEQTFGPEDVFHYIYAVFHSPTYRQRYAEFLKIDFPRVPLTSDRALFAKLCALGERLTRLHLMEEEGEGVSVSFPVRGHNTVEAVRYTAPGEGAEKGRVWINKEQFFEGVPPEVWEFHVGGYQVAEKWLKDRKGRTLSLDDREHYRGIVAALYETGRLMREIDRAIGEWPVK